MADDGSTQQQPAQTADKAQAPATFSSFINKSSSGKKFAPKAARRRPGAAPAAGPRAPVPTPAAAPTASTADTQPAQSSDPTAKSSVAALLPTPAPTQEAPTTTQSDAPHNITVASRLSSTIAATEPPPPPPAAPTAALESTPAPVPATEPSQSTQPVVQPPPTQPAEDDFTGGRSPKRRRIESPSRQSTPQMPVAVMVPSQDVQTIDTAPLQPTPQTGEQATLTAEDGEASTSTDLTPSADAETSAQGTKRNAPWTAVNHLQEEGGEASEVVEPPAKKKRAPPKPRGKRKTAAAGGEGAQQEVGDDGQPVEPPPKKARKPRKDKGKQPAIEGETENGEPGQEGATPAAPKRKPRAPRRKKATPTEGEDGSVEPKRRGRPPREDTPSDAEDHAIDPDAMCMDDLASRNIRVGKLSRREKEMRKIDWDAVKQRRREEDARHISTKESQAAVDKLLEMGESEPAPTGPRYHVVDGRIELIQDSGTIDRERDADREIELMTITEEDDLTTRITSRSFMKNNKRFPNEFVLPGQGKRWTPQSTEVFYQGLRSFGTDFQMIAHMFPGMTRRSIKTKFTREERENPDLVRDCLRGTSQLATHWDHFLEASQLEEESFADADAIKRDLEEEAARMREQIDEALREKAEREKQKRLAGVAEGEGAENGEGGNAKGKKKRAKKDKSVAFVEEGVEVLGDIDDDPNWGQE